MTMMAVKEGVFRACLPAENRGVRKRRGELMPIARELPVTSSAHRLDGEIEPEAELRVQYSDGATGRMTLRVSGTLDLSTVLAFRDAVFTAIGKKPLDLFVDVTGLRDADISGISALVTAGRVARLMKVPFAVSPSPFLKPLLEDAGICLTSSVMEAPH